MELKSHLPAIIFAIVLVVGTTGVGAASYGEVKYGDPGAVFSKTSDSLSRPAGLGFSATTGLFGSLSSSSSTECPPGTTLMAKYEWVNETLEFEFVEGPEGDVIIFSNIQDKKDEKNEPTSFDWEVDQSKTNTKVSALVVKYGTSTTSEVFEGTYSGSFSLEEEDPAISHVLFCSAEYYQVDLIEGDPGPLSSDNTYNDQDRLVQAVTVSSAGVVTTRVHPGSANKSCIDDYDITFNVDKQNATVMVGVTDSPGCEALTLSLVGYELPNQDTRFVRANAGDQVLVDSKTVTIEPGEAVKLEVSLNG